MKQNRSLPELNHHSAKTSEKKVFYGRRMIIVAFVVDFIAVGFFFYSYGVFFKEIAHEFGGSRLQAALGLTVANGVAAIASPFLGRALDEYPIKNLMVAGATTVSIGFLLLSQITAQWQFYLILGSFIALGTTTMGGLAASKLVANWFILKRGTALGLATMGISLSGMIMPLIATWLISVIGWRGAFIAYAGATMGLVVPIVLLFVINRPEDINQHPDGNSSLSTTDVIISPTNTSTKQILTHPTFWIISLTFALVLSSLGPILTNMIPFITDMGISPYRAASILSLSAGAGVLGKIVFGWLADNLDTRMAVIVSILAQLLGVIFLTQASEYATLLIAAMIFGFGMGGVVPLQATITGKIFGREYFGKVMGLLRPTMMPITLIGLPLSNWIYDTYGSYQAAFKISIGAYILAIFIISRLNLNNQISTEVHPRT